MDIKMPKEDLRDTQPQDSSEVKGGEGSPGNPYARDQCRLGNLYAESMLYEYAIEAYKRAINSDPNYAMAHHHLGAVYYKMGLFDEAQEELKTAIKLHTDVPLFHYTLGLVLYDDKNLSECIASFSTAVSLAPDYVEAYYRRGIAYFYGDDPEKACSDFEKVVDLNPGFRNALYNLGVVYISLKRWEDAREVFRSQLVLKPGDSDAFYHMGLIHEIGRDTDQAMECFQKAVDIDPHHFEARFQLSLLHARKRYTDPLHRQKAIAQLRSLVEIYEESEDFDRIHDALFLLGGLYDDDPNDIDLAIEAYENGLRLADWSAEVHNNLGVLYSRKGAIDKAVKEFREAIKLDPDYGSPYHNLAKIYFYQRDEDIVKDFQQWIQEASEESAKILFNLSLALIDVGRAEACDSIYSKAHRIKNLIGVAGSKLRHVSKDIDTDESGRLTEVLTDQEKCYNEMVSLLSALKQENLVLDMVDISTTIDSALRQVGFMPDGEVFRLGNVECRMELAENLPKVKGDHRKLKEAFNNIVVNALEAMSDSGSLEIRMKYSEPTSGVEIAFRDTGKGIPDRDLGNVFKPGYTTKESGSGFGLSIVDRIIREHKGSVHISSREGEGTEVRIYLPVNLELAPIQTSLRMRPVIYEDPTELISTEIDQIVRI